MPALAELLYAGINPNEIEVQTFRLPRCWHKVWWLGTHRYGVEHGKIAIKSENPVRKGRALNPTLNEE